MKNLFKIIAIAILIATVMSAPNTNKKSEIYSQTMTVIEIENDIVTIEDPNGFTYQFDGAEDWMIGDICSCLMDSKGTKTIFDDEIINARYSGYVEGLN